MRERSESGYEIFIEDKPADLVKEFEEVYLKKHWQYYPNLYIMMGSEYTQYWKDFLKSKKSQVGKSE